MSTDGLAHGYLKQALALDFTVEGDELFALRRHFKNGGRPETPKITREEARGVIDAVRQSLWDGPDLSSMQSLDLGHLPDVARERAQLLQVDSLRDVFEDMDDDARLPQPFVEALREVVTEGRGGGSERDARFRGLVRKVKMRRIKRALSAVRRSYPDVYELEPSWFERLRHADKERVKMKRSLSLVGCLMTWFALSAVGKVIRWIASFFTEG